MTLADLLASGLTKRTSQLRRLKFDAVLPGRGGSSRSPADDRLRHRYGYGRPQRQRGRTQIPGNPGVLPSRACVSRSPIPAGPRPPSRRSVSRAVSRSPGSVCASLYCTTARVGRASSIRVNRWWPISARRSATIRCSTPYAAPMCARPMIHTWSGSNRALGLFHQGYGPGALTGTQTRRRVRSGRPFLYSLNSHQIGTWSEAFSRPRTTRSISQASSRSAAWGESIR